MLYDTTPLPDSIPKVQELGVSSAPLLSASFFIGARCRDYNDDYMKCKTDNPGRGEFECLQEGRRVTRCARSVYVYPACYQAFALSVDHSMGSKIPNWEANTSGCWRCD